MVRSAYIHIPFCRQKCHYCSFVSFPALDKKGDYLAALKSQVLAEYKGEPLATLYFGGGTPSLLNVGEIKNLLSLFNFSENPEITLELNPETVDEEYVRELSKTRVNRLSIGVQTFDDEILKLIGRRHKSSDVERVVREARKYGFENISLDFIYGLPNQSLESFISDLEKAAALGVEHISLYGLKIEEGCYFASHRPKNIAGEDLQAEMYLMAAKTLKKHRFEHYEISNFSRSGKYSRHNVNYWKNQEYYGFGLAAHGYVDGVRYSNPTELETYLKTPQQKDFEQKLTRQEQLEEEIFLGLRLLGGIDVKNVNQKFGIDFEKKYAKILEKYISTGHIVCEEGVCKFNYSGILVSNTILSEFLE